VEYPARTESPRFVKLAPHHVELFETGKAAVSDLHESPVDGRLSVSIDVPVHRGGRVQWLITALLDPVHLSSTLAAQVGERDAMSTVGKPPEQRGQVHSPRGRDQRHAARRRREGGDQGPRHGRRDRPRAPAHHLRSVRPGGAHARATRGRPRARTRAGARACCAPRRVRASPHRSPVSSRSSRSERPAPRPSARPRHATCSSSMTTLTRRSPWRS
jgi:hypothetical protein